MRFQEILGLYQVLNSLRINMGHFIITIPLKFDKINDLLTDDYKIYIYILPLIGPINSLVLERVLLTDYQNDTK